ncbi:MAG: Gfo/Idh/MocA family oxidoreductase, partial [Dehalococcoidia bacterium]|nr:Gfo/Idh/MocA family oxidoreductase [Dehalococcoidia bacterium]
YDMATRSSDRFDVDDVNRPTPELDVHRRIHHHKHPGKEGLPTSYAEALWDRDEVDLVAGADRDSKRLNAFTQRYGVEAVYTDAAEMLAKERLDIVAVATNTKTRADLTCLAVDHGAKGIFTEKPMAHTLEQADRMVKMCADAGVALNCGAISTTHPSFAKAKELVTTGAIGEVLSIEAEGANSQHQKWSYFLNSSPAWVIGIGDKPRRDGGSDEFRGQGMMVTVDGQVVYYRDGAPGVRIAGSKGEIVYNWTPGWRLWQHVEGLGPRERVEMPWPEPQFVPPYGGVYSLNDVIDCMEGRLDEPKNSGRRVAIALEVEIAMKQSSVKGGLRIDLPLKDRTLGLNYDWFR